VGAHTPGFSGHSPQGTPCAAEHHGMLTRSTDTASRRLQDHDLSCRTSGHGHGHPHAQPSWTYVPSLASAQSPEGEPCEGRMWHIPGARQKVVWSPDCTTHAGSESHPGAPVKPHPAPTNAAAPQRGVSSSRSHVCGSACHTVNHAHPRFLSASNGAASHSCCVSCRQPSSSPDVDGWAVSPEVAPSSFSVSHPTNRPIIHSTRKNRFISPHFAKWIHPHLAEPSSRTLE
jgi:hypothetical protein